MSSRTTALMTSDLINVLLESTVTVLSTMAMVDATPGKPIHDSEASSRGDVTGMIDLVGDRANGFLAISFSEAAILDITEKMLGETTESIDTTVVDVVGEITNMVTGMAKRLLSELGVEFDLTLPSMMVGRERPQHDSVRSSPILLPFTTAAGEFYVEAGFSQSPA